MSTFKYWVRYKNGPSITNISWNTQTNIFESSSVSSSGVTAVPKNTWVEVQDSNVDSESQFQSLLYIQSNIQANPSISATETLCNSYLIMTASLNPTLSLGTSTSSITLSGSLTGSFVNPQWSYVSSNMVNITESVIHYISSSFISKNKSQQFDSFLQTNTLYNFTIGTPDSTFQPQNIVWTQLYGPAPLWFMTSTTSSATLVVSASISGSYGVVAQQQTTTPQYLTVSQSLPNSSFNWIVFSEPSKSTTYINSSSNHGNGTFQSVSVSASVAGNYIFEVTEQSNYSFYPTGSVVSSSGASITLHLSNYSQSGQYTYALSAYNLCNEVISETVQINITGFPPVVVSDSGSYVKSSSINYHITASNSPTAFYANNLPSNLNLNSSTGVISGILTQTGSYVVGISASNSFGMGYGTYTFLVHGHGIQMVFTQSGNGGAHNGNPTYLISIDGSSYQSASVDAVTNYTAYSTLKFKTIIAPGTYDSSDILQNGVKGSLTTTDGLSFVADFTGSIVGNNSEPLGDTSLNLSTSLTTFPPFTYFSCFLSHLTSSFSTSSHGRISATPSSLTVNHLYGVDNALTNVIVGDTHIETIINIIN